MGLVKLYSDQIKCIILKSKLSLKNVTYLRVRKQLYEETNK